MISATATATASRAIRAAAVLGTFAVCLGFSLSACARGQTPGTGHTAPATRAVSAVLGELQVLFDTRAAAVRSGDRAAWSSTVDSTSAPVVAEQSDRFQALAAVPLAALRYEVREVGPIRPDGQAVADVRVHYRFDVDPSEVTRDQQVPVVQRGGRWSVAGRATGAVADLWDVGPVTVVRTTRAVVIAAADSSDLDRSTELARRFDQAAAQVDAAWGTRWPRRVVVLVPSQLRQAAALLGRSAGADTQFGGLDQWAALTITPAGAAGGADRVVVVPGAFDRLTPIGQQVVLAHELTHIATREARVLPPLWLQEGFAEYVGYLGSGLSPAQIAAEALPQVRLDGPPVELPADAAFDTARGDVAAAYAQSWAACAVVALDGGVQRVVAFYRAAASTGLDAAITTVLGQTRAQFQLAWSQYLVRLAAA